MDTATLIRNATLKAVETVMAEYHLVPKNAPVAPATPVEVDPIVEPATIQIHKKNGKVYREIPIRRQSRNEIKNLHVFKILFESGYHHYEICRMVKGEGYSREACGYVDIHDMAKSHRFSDVKKNVLRTMKGRTSNLHGRIANLDNLI